jgi:uncharacterized protein
MRRVGTGPPPGERLEANAESARHGIGSGGLQRHLIYIFLFDFMTTIVSCPICAKKVEWKPESRYRPFCSERCKEIDLGAWATGQYKIGSTDEEPPTDEAQGDLN